MLGYNNKMKEVTFNHKKLFYYKYFLLPCPIWLPLFSNEPEMGTEIESGMIITPFPSSILDETRFEPTTYRS
jgi:hypothetical protein